MKLLPAVLTLSCAAVLLGCGRSGGGPPEADQQEQAQLIEEQQAQQLREMHEKEAALDERERLLALKEQQLNNPTAVAAPQEQPVQPAPAPPVAAPAPTASQPSPDASVQAFYDALSPYGAWMRMPGYGYVWQPAATAQNPQWRPYTLGHWVFTDEGWAWVSDEPFGWVTYHYGRWMRTRTLGWVWTPGDQWAPAWVSWRYGNDYAGWAPLPPEAQFDNGTGIKQWADQQYSLTASDYTFVPAAEFGDDNMADNEVPAGQAGPIYDDSDNITNIYYDPGVYAIVCYGPNYDFMRSKSRRPFPPRYTLMRAGYREGGNNGAVISGNTIRIAAPRVSRSAPGAAPRSVRGSVADTRVITPAGPPPAPGEARTPIYPPANRAGVPQPLNPAVRPQATGPGVASEAAPAGMTGGSRAQLPPNPAPAASGVEEQRAREAQIIQQEQAARELEHQRQDLEAARAAAAHSAAESAEAEHAAAEAATAQNARSQAAHQAQVPHALPPSNAPMGSPAGRSAQ